MEGLAPTDLVTLERTNPSFDLEASECMRLLAVFADFLLGVARQGKDTLSIILLRVVSKIGVASISQCQMRADSHGL